MTKFSSYTIFRNDDLPIVADCHAPEKGTSAVPVILFLHGFKGFKDWGPFPLVAEFLSRAGFAVVRFNFSHNGTTPEHPTEFADPEAFGKNTFSRELEEVAQVIDDLWLRGEPYMDLKRIGLIGHSRGGGIALLAAKSDDRIRAVATWAGVSDLEPRVNPKNLEQWYRDRVIYAHNARTGQDLPQYYSLREDFYRNKKKLDIAAAVKAMPVPQFIAHGTADESVNFSEAEQLKEWNPAAELLALQGANHTFGGKHPWDSKELPADMAKALQATIAFFRGSL